jgi:hypothetical protein
MPDRHMSKALERIPDLVDAFVDGREDEVMRQLRRVPFGQWPYLAGYLLSMCLDAVTAACDGDQDRARDALRTAIHTGIHEDLVTNDVRQILREAARKEGMTDVD